MSALRCRPRLQHLLRLSCLCLTESSSTLPTIRLQGRISSDPQCRLSDVSPPVQSYLASVPLSVTLLPWTHVDAFGQYKCHMAITSAFKSQSASTVTTKSAHFNTPSVISEEVGASFSSPDKTTKAAQKGVLPTFQHRK